MATEQKRIPWISIAFAVLAAAGGLASGIVWNLSGKLAHYAVENEQMRFADEGMLRSRTDFQRPGITEEQVRIMSQIADDYGAPDWLVYAFYRTERGRMGMELGANKIDADIRAKYPPLWWQFAMGMKTWNKHLNKTSMGDPYVQRRTLWSFARQWNPDPENWTATAMANIQRARSKGLEVTEPPKQRQSVATAKEAEARASKAIGASHNRPKDKRTR